MMIKVRYCFLSIVILYFTAGGLLSDTVPGNVTAKQNQGQVTTIEQLRQARKVAAHRQRRIIFNNDGNESVYYLKEASAKALLDCRTTPLVGTHVDSIFYCTWSSGFSFFTHDTKVGQVFDTTVNPKHPANQRGGFSKNKTREFINQGTDPLQIMVEFCKQQKIEIFWSFRMNDTHDASSSWYGEPLFPPLKKDHPEWLVASKKKRCRYGGWTAMDFNHREVRELAVKFIEEVCENYNIDGIEMDFFRHPVYFKNPAWGRDATQEELDRLTDMVRNVREVTERIGLKRGRPILVGVRIPDSVDYCKAMGIDIERWLREDLIDIMAVSGYFRLNDWEISVQLGHKHDVPVYACLSETRMRDDQARKLRASVECYRGRAANVWDSGADGIYMFNFFDPHSPLWRQLGDAKVLATMDKIYTTGARGVNSINGWMANGEKRFLRHSALSPERPATLRPGRAVSIELRVAEGTQKATPRELMPEMQLRLRVSRLNDPTDLSVKLNGQPLSRGARSEGWFDYSIGPQYVKKGKNIFEITLIPENDSEPILHDLVLWVRNKTSP